MANVKFFQGQESNLDNLSKKAGQVLLALNNNEGSLYYDINSNTRIKLNAKNADTANRLTNSRTILTNLGSTSSASFNGTANITPGITGTLSIAHGGTGATTAADARNNIGAAASNHSHSVVTTSANGLMSAADKSKLDGIAANANKYTHPSYTAKSSGLYKITVDSLGHISTTTAVTKADITALGIPGTDTNTTYSAFKGATSSAGGGAGLVPAPAQGASNRYLRSDGTWQVPPDTNTTYGLVTTSANGLMSASDKKKLDGIASGANKYTHPGYTARNSGLYKITVDSSGHISAVTAVTKSDITALGIPGQDTNTVYTHPTSSGNKHIPSGGSSGQILRWSANGTAVWGNDNNTTYSNFRGASTSAAGGSGLVPAPAQGSANRYLRSDGTWQVPPNTVYRHPTSAGNKHIPAGGSSGQILRWSSSGTAVWGNDNNTTYGVATTSANGLMSASDKVKLNGIATGANRYIHPSYTARSSGLYKVTVDSTGHVSSVASVTKSDITALGIPSTNTTYGVATTSANGLMSASDKVKLNGIATNANRYIHPTSAGYKHIPSGGSSGQILRWSSSGTAVWDRRKIYSSSEVNTGNNWIDGKRIYRISGEWTGTIVNGGRTDIPLKISGKIDTVVHANVFSKAIDRNNSNYYSYFAIAYWNGDPYAMSFLIVDCARDHYDYPLLRLVTTGSMDTSGRTIIYTIEYTKV